MPNRYEGEAKRADQESFDLSCQAADADDWHVARRLHAAAAKAQRRANEIRKGSQLRTVKNAA